MKKVVLSLVLAFIMLLSGAVYVDAQLEEVDGCTLVEEIHYEGESYGPGAVDTDNDIWPILCGLNMINRVANLVFYALITLVVALVILGGFYILTGGQKEENISKGKKLITFAIIGAFVAIFANAVPTLINFFVG